MLNFFIFSTAFLALSTNAFFLNWATNEKTTSLIKPQQAWLQQQQQQQQHQLQPAYMYQQRLLQPQPQPQSYGMQSEMAVNPLAHAAAAAMSIPAIPIQVPLQAHLSPASNIQNVELVPCMCPYTIRDPGLDKNSDSAAYQLAAAAAASTQN